MSFCNPIPMFSPQKIQIKIQFILVSGFPYTSTQTEAPVPPWFRFPMPRIIAFYFLLELEQDRDEPYLVQNLVKLFPFGRIITENKDLDFLRQCIKHSGLMKEIKN